MKAKMPLVARILLGLMFFVFGLIGLLNLIPVPPDLPEALQTFNKGMEASVYFMPFVKGTEVVCGLLLLSGMLVPLALVVLAPITLNIFLVHAFMAPDGLVLAVIIGLLQIYLALFSPQYSPKIKALFRK